MPNLAADALSPQELARYSRHLTLPEVGLEGQRKLKAGRVLVIGAGGLGSPALLYLAAAGVGTIGVVDNDVVDVTNLQRQVIHDASGLGAPKTGSAQARMHALNSEVAVIEHRERLTSLNALEILSAYDVIVDGSDNLPTRYLASDACVMLAKPLVYGAVYRFEGQASVFDARSGPCYRCLFPQPPPPEAVPSCEEGGVLGVLPGVVGLIQATETVKLLLGAGRTLVGRLLLFDALEMRFSELQVRKDPDCPACGAHPTVTALIDYELFCGRREAVAMNDITPLELKAKLDSGEPIELLDVREPYELEIAALPYTKHIPVNDVAQRARELDPSKELVIYCRSGVRSGNAVKFLREKGFSKARNLTGGILRWADDVDPAVTKY